MFHRVDIKNRKSLHRQCNGVKPCEKKE